MRALRFIFLLTFLCSGFVLANEITKNENTIKGDIELKKKNYDAAFKYFILGSKEGDATSEVMLGEMYANGLGFKVNKKLALDWYLKAAKKGSAVAQNNAGDLYFMGSETFPKDHKKAFYWTKKAAEQGLVGAQINLGSFYYMGTGTPKNIEKGIEWIIKAAETGDESALGLFKLIRGNPINEKDFFNHHYNLAMKGTEISQHQVGIRYLLGKGVDKNLNQAIYWLTKASEQGYADAQYLLGLAYQNGEGVVKDVHIAISWFLKAANQDNANAQFSLGLLYATEKSIGVDLSASKKWFKKAAAQGHEKAQRYLNFNELISKY